MSGHFPYTRKHSSKTLAWKFPSKVEEMGDLVVTKHHKVFSKPADWGKIEGIMDTTHKGKQDIGDASLANGCGNGEGSHSGHSELAKICVDADASGTNMDNSGVFNRQVSRCDKVSGIHKPDGLQELLQITQEYESGEASQGDLNEKSHSSNKGLERYSLEPKVVSSSSAKEDANNHKEGIVVTCSEEARLDSSTLEGEVSAACSTLEVKSDLKGDLRNLDNKEEDWGCSEVHASANRRGSRSVSLASITVGPSRSQFTIPQPFSLATDKRALGGRRPRDAEHGLTQKALGSSGTSCDRCSRTPEISGSRLHAQKSLRPEIIKRQEDTFKKLSIRETPEPLDEDAMSISSIKSCLLAPKAKASRFTSTSSFKFQSDVRAEKRKEYFAKLQERLVAKEEEMNQLQAKAKKERDEEIKVLRKSLTFKAHPVPSFYQEGPPQKAELPKTPTTRAKSPNFSRRESSLGGSTRLCNIIKCEADHRSSFSPKPGKGSNIDLIGNDEHGKNSVKGKCLTKSPENKSAEASALSSGRAFELPAVEFSVEDMHVKGQDPLIVSSELMTNDEEDEVHLPRVIQNKHADSNGGIDFYHDDVSSLISCKTSAINDSCERLDCQVRASNLLQGQLTSPLSGNKAKPGKKIQPLVLEDSNDLHGKEGNQSAKKQRYKALTPYFRKGESRRDEGQAAAREEMPSVNINSSVESK